MRESSIFKLIIGGVLAILTTLGVFWFLNNFEEATREVTTGYSKEAQNNPFLAAELFLKRVGVNTASITASELWRTMPQPGDAVVFLRFTQPRSKPRQEQLRKWVEAGGHLIIDADSLPNADTHKSNHPKNKSPEKDHDFLSDLGVRVSHPDFDKDKDLGEKRVSIKFEDIERPVNVTMTNYRYLLDTDDQAVAGAKLDKGYGLLQYEVGDGYVTVLADNRFLSNREIGKEDHALALALLVGTHHDYKVWLVHDITMPSLPELGWRYAPYAVSAALIASLLWLWSMGARIGPRLPPAQTPRRDIGEHLTATANYLWRLDHGKALLQANRQRIEQAWLNKHYILRTMPLQERCEWIAARSGLSAAVVERALYSQHHAESEFIEQSSYLQILRAAL